MSISRDFGAEKFVKVNRPPQTPRPLKDRSLTQQRRERQQKPVFIKQLVDFDIICDICEAKMFRVDKGEHAGNFVCGRCGLTVNPQTEFTSHAKTMITATDEENPEKALLFAQMPEDERTKPKPSSMYDILDETERDLREQLYSKGHQLVDVQDLSGNIESGPSGGFNKITRPRKEKQEDDL